MFQLVIKKYGFYGYDDYTRVWNRSRCSNGMNTAMGQIANMLQNAEQMETPLQRRLEQLGKILIIVALILTALVVLAGVYQGNEVYHMFLAGVSLAVAAIPEGLPAIVTVALSLGVQRMIKKKQL